MHPVCDSFTGSAPGRHANEPGRHLENVKNRAVHVKFSSRRLLTDPGMGYRVAG